jgi:hypothetical protein
MFDRYLLKVTTVSKYSLAIQGLLTIYVVKQASKIYLEEHLSHNPLKILLILERAYKRFSPSSPP